MNNKEKIKSPIKVLVLTMITCGIYGLIWIYRLSSDINEYLNKEELRPGLEVFLCIICFPYGIYWSYKLGKLIAEAQQKAMLPVEDNSILFLALAVFGLFFVNMAIMQDQVNKIWEKEIL